MCKEKLESLDLYKDEENGCYYLKAVYSVEREDGFYEVTFPKILLNVNQTCGPSFITECTNHYARRPDSFIDIGFGSALLRKDEGGHLYTEKLIKEKVHDVTLAEIEKKFGYKVRIVNEK